jgi:RimJ/RimL family protein N-acetyltransferase
LPAVVVPAPFAPVPVTLEGRTVRLEPLGPQHADGLLAAGCFASLWTVTVQPPLDTVDAVQGYLAQAARNAERGEEVPFAIIARESDMLIGSTRWMDISRVHRRLEIGGTWITPSMQGTLANTEAKYLQLVHLFEVCGALRVQFKTDLRNSQSQRALEKIGAVREGVFRRHMVVRDGFVRDSVYYGITDIDWPGVKRRLEERLATGA